MRTFSFTEQQRLVLMAPPFSILEERWVDGHTLLLSDDEASDLRDAVGDELLRIGFDVNYDVTSDGAVLESLIDVLYVE